VPAHHPLPASRHPPCPAAAAQATAKRDVFRVLVRSSSQTSQPQQAAPTSAAVPAQQLDLAGHMTSLSMAETTCRLPPGCLWCGAV
jgi:hypothetical protein